MPLDGLMLRALSNELQLRILGAHIDKIYQPQKLLLAFNIRHKREPLRLLISAHSQHPRIHLTAANLPNPKSPPMFCMLLRKHLEGGKITAINHQGLERILDLTIESRDEIGQMVERHLIVEIMGKHSNIILLDDNTIIDAIKRYTHAVNRYREVLPGLPYLPPPSQNKENPLAIQEETFRQVLLTKQLEQTVSQALVASLEGFSPLLAREVVCRAGLEQYLVLEHCGDFELRQLWHALLGVLGEVNGSPNAVLLKEDQGEGYSDFAPLQLKLFPAAIQELLLGPSVTLDTFYTTADKIRQREAKRNELVKIVNKEIKRCNKKASLQQQTVDLSAETEKYRIAGELITANIYRLQRGDSLLTCENYYAEQPEEVTLELKPELSPAENAQYYFRRYNKAKSSALQAREQLEKTRLEWDYLESILYAVFQAEDLPELEAVEKELSEAGYINRPLPPVKKKEKTAFQPLSFVSSDGFGIMVGKNNRQNDQLALRFARDEDLWLHVKDIPGSHVIISGNGKEIPDRTIEEGAILAAFYSKASHSANVPVDYTQKKHVKKPGGAKPGMVIYDNQTTVYVTPSEEKVNSLRNQA